MNKKELINEYSILFNKLSEFIENNSKQVTLKSFRPSSPNVKMNGFLISIFKEFGNDSPVILGLLSDFLTASFKMTSGSALNFNLIFSSNSKEVVLTSALVASRPVIESCIKMHYITSMPLDTGIRFLVACNIDHWRRLYNLFGGQDKIDLYKEFSENNQNLLSKLNLPLNKEINKFSKDDQDVLSEAVTNHDVITMARKAKKHINKNLSSNGLEIFTHESLIRHYTTANNFIHINPPYITAPSKNRHFWITTMVLPTMFINCFLMTKFAPTKKRLHQQKVLTGYIEKFIELNSNVQSTWLK